MAVEVYQCISVSVWNPLRLFLKLTQNKMVADQNLVRYLGESLHI